MTDWAATSDRLAQFARHQLFFVGGAPRSGTTWLQQMLDAHPDVCCRGEGLFLNHLAVPLERMMAGRAQVIEGKNHGIFTHTGGYPLPVPEDGEFLVGSAILLAMQRQAAGGTYRAIGEKTPENVFFFPRLRRLFPGAKFIAIARDPRDVLASAWHFFAKKEAGQNEPAAKRAFVAAALPSLNEGAQAMKSFGDAHPAEYAMVTYENMLRDPASELARLYRLLGLDDRAALVAECLDKTSFRNLSGREAGDTRNGTFFRQGKAGNWRETLSDEHDQQIKQIMGWAFPVFGWEG